MTRDERLRQIQSSILDFIESKWGKTLGPGSIQPSDNLFLEGIIDSIGVLALVGFLEEEFDLEVDPEQLVLENFESVRAMSELVKRLEESRP